MSPRTPALTIGVPVYNGERFIGEALDSLLAQTFSDFVVQISDNASTDGTRAICERYMQRDPRVHYLRQDRNRGAGHNFNEVVRLSTSPFFAWHAADDLAAPRYHEACIKSLDAKPAAALAYTEATTIDERGERLPGRQGRLNFDLDDVVDRFAQCLAPFPYGENVFYGVMRTPVLKQTRLLGAFGGSDRAFLAELSLYGPFARVGEALFLRRVPDVGRSEAEVQRYNAGRRRLSLREWHILRWNLQSVRRAKLPAGTRARLYRAMARRLLLQRGLYAAELKLALKDLAHPM